MRPRTWLLALLAGAIVAALPGGAARAQQLPAEGHAYVLRATLDPEEHVVDGRGRIRWVNESDRSVDSLYFHLYLNAFESDDTVFMRESGGQLRGVELQGRGSIEVTELRLIERASPSRQGQKADGEAEQDPEQPQDEAASGDGDDVNLLATADDELVDGDRTQMRTPLPEPVEPGGSVVLEVRFRSELPPVFARSGYAGDFHMVAQWFPKLARLEPWGEWESFPYHGHGEFYADFAYYDLTVTTPRGWVVGATGREVGERADGLRVTRRFIAEDVHDTAFAAWPHFVEHTEDVGGIAVRVLAPPGHGLAVDRHLAVVRQGLRHYGKLYGPYPYSTLTVIVPPRGAEGAAGMEYPTLFVTAGPWLTIPGVWGGAHDEVTAHELAHQWFQGLVATNEVRWPMLDEGITTWATGNLLAELHGRDRSAIGPPWGSLDGFEMMRWLALRLEGRTPPSGSPAHAFEGIEYGRAVYARPAVTLETIARTWGRERTELALGRYARRHRFGHPTPHDLFRAFDETFWSGFSDRVLEPALMQNRRASVQLTEIRNTKTEDGVRSELLGVRDGRLPVPTRVIVYDAQGGTRSVSWRGTRKRLRHVSDDGRIVAARADPDRNLMLDPSVLDDGVTTEQAPSPSRGLLGRLLFLWQSLLGVLGP